MNNKSTVMIVDDHKSERFILKSRLGKWGYSVLEADSVVGAFNYLESDLIPDLVISDQMMPDTDGIEFLRKVKKNYRNVPFIMLTGHGSIDKAVISMREGADDYLIKPVNPQKLQTTITRSLKFHQLDKEYKELKNYLKNLYGFDNIIAESPSMTEALSLAAKAAGIPNMTITLFGESGTGKELLARAIHTASGCLDSRFVGINCAAIPEGLMESELFGHVKGAFTGAGTDREGKFSQAGEGTLLLDEIGDMPFDLQAKLLRVLQERVYEKVGSDQRITAKTRAIAATNCDLEKLVEMRRFREDLFHRLNVFPVTLPPLRERKEDIPLLANHFIEQFRNHFGKPFPGLSESAMELLSDYHWPGNVRELKNCIERAIIVNNGELIRPTHLNFKKKIERTGSNSPEENGRININMSFDTGEFSLDAAVNRILQTALKKCDNNKVRAAELLKVGRNIFYRRKL
ncbi:MAG: sigma-54-dependent Fis family transcriptional regulator [Desulfobacteraceae bacterium]|nr:sigma-54-dependent Fis family transcriptional regulator [Desulfobacteraceae bacterium]